MKRPLLLLACFLVGSFRADAQVLINEIMASNARSVPDIVDFEDYPDWFELKNTTNAAVSLDGYFISDNPATPFKWAIPSSASIPANGYLVIIADGHDAAPGQSFPRGYWPWLNFTTEKYHSNFSLAATGQTLTLTNATGLSSATQVSAGSVWKYKDNGSDQSTQWRAGNFDDSSWASGPAQLGYGDGDESTTVSYGPDANNKYHTTYFRHHFTVVDPAVYSGLTMSLVVDDGCVVYLNGVEVVRRNMAAGEVDYTTLANVTVGGGDESAVFTYILPASGLIAGDNVLAVEVHQAAGTSSDISFDLGLAATLHTSATTLDRVTFGQQVTDISYGRDNANPNIWRQFAEPTPGAANTTAVVDDIRITGNDVTVSLPAGLYAGNQTVTLSVPSGQIRYTLNGSDPKSSSPLYTAPLNVTGTTVLRARCFASGKAPGAIVTRTYLFGETITNVPYISVVADPETLFGNTIGIYKNQHEPYVGSDHAVFKGKDAPANLEFFAPGGAAGFATSCGIRIGGENNWPHAQKALNIYIDSKYGNDVVTYDLFPGNQTSNHTSFTLRDGGDNWEREMLRDGLMPKLGKGILKADTYDYRPSVVFINGVYWGIHNIRERWDETWFSEYYHLAADKIDHLIYGHVTGPEITLGAQLGDTNDWVSLMTFMSTADLTVQANWDYVESKIDMDSFMDFIIAESYSNNTSWPWNREFWRDRSPGGKWHWFLPDMDRTWDTGTLSGILGQLMGSEDALVRLKVNPGFKQRLAQRFAAHAAGTFAPARVIATISAMDAENTALVARHAALWAPLGGMSVGGRASNIQNIKDYANARATNIHGEVASELGVGTAVDLTLGVNTPGGGTFLVQGVPVSSATFKMFPNIPFTLTAVAAPGYVFSSWTGVVASASNISVTLSGASAISANFVASGETTLGGTLAANTTLTTANSPYSLSSDLIIPPGVTLTIQPGVIIHMPALRNIRVQGTLNVSGTAAQPVTLSGRNGERWGGISLEDGSGPSNLAHLIIRGATRGYDPVLYDHAITGHNASVVADFIDINESALTFYMYGGSCVVRDSVFYSPYTGDGIHVKKGSALIQRCTLLGNNAPDTDAIDFDGVMNGVIEDCRIYRFQGFNSDALDMGEGCSNILLQANAIYYCNDKGISVGQGSTVTLRKNLIVGCNLGVGIKDYGSHAIIDQNTFVGCTTNGVAIYEKNFGKGGGSAVMTNTLISKAAIAPVTVDSFSTISTSYCLSDTVALGGTNNLLVDPQFVDAAVLNYQLKPTSPAIDAGDPAHSLDANGTRVDIGAQYAYSPADYPYTIGERVVINEILANSGLASDWIELYNRTTAPIDIGGWFLSDDGADLLKYRIPVDTIIPAHGYLVFYEDTNFGAASVDVNKITPFALSDVGETVYLSSAHNDQLTDYQSKEDAGPSIEGETVGFYYKPSTDSYNFIPLKTPTPGAANSGPSVGPIVISEIMYNPAGSGTGDAEYLELLNVTDAPVTLYDSLKAKPWIFSDGIAYEFPSAIPLTMAPGERLVLTKNLSVFNSLYGALVPGATRVIQWTSGSLSNASETVQLVRPGAVDGLNVQQYVRVDKVVYSDSLPWPTPPDGHGPSLTKISEKDYGNDPINWMAADPSPGSIAFGNRFATWADRYGVSGAGTDSDGDGVPNLLEYVRGTNPT
ncbi:MAG: lamin tail domain-containing protein, partial [Verrucomicrobiota bacterium]